MMPGMFAAGAMTQGGSPPVGLTWSQSSVYLTTTPASDANMLDSNTNPAAGAATGTGTTNAGNQWVKCDLGSPKTIVQCTLGGGNIPIFGVVSPYLNGNKLQYSTDDVIWTDVLTISGVTDSMPLDKDFSVPSITAQYWRIFAAASYLATATFKLSE